MNSKFINETNLRLKNAIKIFKRLTGVNIIDYKFLQKGEKHVPSKLGKDEQGVYIFISDSHCLKVGSVGDNSQPRWNSNHYTKPFVFTEKNFYFSSTLSRSLVTKTIKNLDNGTAKRTAVIADNGSIKYFPDDSIKDELTKLYDFVYDVMAKKDKYMEDNKYIMLSNKATKSFSNFVKENTHRFEIKINSEKNTNAIRLLESMVIYALNPVYEGNKTFE